MAREIKNYIFVLLREDGIRIFIEAKSYGDLARFMIDFHKIEKPKIFEWKEKLNEKYMHLERISYPYLLNTLNTYFSSTLAKKFITRFLNGKV